MKHRLHFLCFLVFLFLSLVGAFLGAAPAQASMTITVNSTLDEPDASGGDGNCVSAPSGQCTLRAAIQEANALVGDDTILLPSGTYTLTIPNPGGVREDAAATGDLNITSNLVISATGATKPIIDGNGNVLTDTVLSIFSSVTVTISGVTLQNGYLVGVANAGTLMLNDSLVIGNTGVNGGGIQNNFGTMTISNSTVSGNTSSFGGGIFNLGVLTVTNSLINNNTCNNGLCGGAIYNGNYGVNSGMLTIINTTIISNSIGTLYNYGGLVILRNSTLSSNDSGIRTINSGTTRLSNTIVANSACIDHVVSDGYNLESGNSCGFTAAGDITNTNPLLGPLADNGGSTLTLALLPGSAAIDAGNPVAPGSGGNACEATDQRSFFRPVDGNINGAATCDIGAFEFGAVALNNQIYLPLILRSP